MSASFPVLNLGQLEWEEVSHGDRFSFRMAPIASRVGAQKLGYRLVEIDPGKRSWPYHFHHANEEMFFVLDGQGTLRLDGNERRVGPGDIVACPAGPHFAHQFYNDTDEPLRMLAVSTMQDPEVVEYPDSAKLGVAAGFAGAAESDGGLQAWLPKGAAVEYWEGE